MAEQTYREERDTDIIKIQVTPISAETKGKVNLAFQDIVDRIKAAHL